MVTSAVASASDTTITFDSRRAHAGPPGPAQELDLPYELGDYLLTEEVGRGGMGIVYRAHQQSLDRPVGGEVDPAWLARFGRRPKAIPQRSGGGRAAGAPFGVVPIYEVGDHRGQLFFSMPFVDGRDARRKGWGDGPLADREAAKIVREVARAIAYAHRPRHHSPGSEAGQHPASTSRAAAFTSLTSASPSGSADGGSRRRLAHQLPGPFSGRPAYMAPEQAAGTRGEIAPRQRTCTASERSSTRCVTGRPPFQGTDGRSTRC